MTAGLPGPFFRTFLILSADTTIKRLLWTAAVFAVAATVLFGQAVASEVNVDENVFIASAALLKHGVMPYRDFHYNHLPTMVLLYAGLFHLTDHLLLAARCCSAACGATVVATVFGVTLSALSAFGPGRRLAFALGAALLLLVNPIFLYASGLAWNHALPMMLCLLAFVAMWRGLCAARPSALLLGLAGVFMGLAVTSRLTFLPGMLGFLLFGVLLPGLSVRQKIALGSVFTVGFALAIVPSLWVWMQAPGNAYFGNFQYPALNTQYHYDTNYWGRLTFNVPQKMLFVVKRVLRFPAYAVAVVLFLVLLWRALRWREILRDRQQCTLFAAAVTTMTLLAGGIAPSPLFRQYLSANLPFLVVVPVLCLACRPELASVRFQRVVAVCLLVAFGFGLERLSGVTAVPFADRWVPMQAHRVGVSLAANVDSDAGRVLTTAPIYAMEGGERIFMSMTTGRFGVRAAEYLSPAEKAQYVMGDADDLLVSFGSDRPPSAVLVAGFDDVLDGLFKKAALGHGYRYVDLPGNIDLWVRPVHRAG